MNAKLLNKSATQSEAEGTTESLWRNGVIHRLQKQNVPDNKTEARPQELLDRYRLLEIIGKGSFGIVYKAHDSKLSRTVAIKVLRDRFVQAGDFFERFAKEAALAGQIEHENVARVYDSHIQDSEAYLVMEFVDGRSLADLRHQFSLPDTRVACELVRKATEGLAAAHHAGLIHRDVKSANLLVTHDLQRVCLTDFGLAINEDGVSSEIAGSLAYMSPEHLDREKPIDARADIYSMGVVLYELLTGSRPFEGTRDTLRQQVLFDPPKSVGERDRRLPRDLVTITDKCLRKDPEERYQSATELAQDLQAWLDGRPIQARPVGRLVRLAKWTRREPVAALLSTSLICGIIAAAAFASYSIREIIDQRNQANASSQFAEQQTDQMFRIIDFSVKEIDEKLSPSPDTQELRIELLGSIAPKLVALSESLDKAPNASVRLLHVRMKMAQIFATIGKTLQAEQSYKDAVKVAERLYNQTPENHSVVQAYVDALMMLGEFQDINLSEFKSAKSNYSRVLQIVNDRTDIPELITEQLVLYRCLGDLALRQRQLDDAHSHLTQAFDLLQSPAAKKAIQREEITRTYEAVGDMWNQNGRFADGAIWLSKALERRETDYQNAPEDTDAAQKLAGCLTVLGRAETNSFQFPNAYKHLRRAVEISTELSTRFPSDQSRKRNLTVVRNELGNLYRTCGDYTNSLKEFQESNKIIKLLHDADKLNKELFWDMLVGHIRLAELHRDNFDIENARREFQTARQFVMTSSNEKAKPDQLGAIDQELASLERAGQIDAASLSAEMLKGIEVILVGTRLNQLTKNQQFDDGLILTRKILEIFESDPAAIDMFDQFNAACSLAECQFQLKEVSDLPRKGIELRNLAREGAIRLIEQLSQRNQLPHEQFGPGLHRTLSLRSLHQDPRIMKILRHIPDPFRDIDKDQTTTTGGPQILTIL